VVVPLLLRLDVEGDDGVDPFLARFGEEAGVPADPGSGDQVIVGEGLRDALGLPRLDLDRAVAGDDLAGHGRGEHLLDGQVLLVRIDRPRDAVPRPAEEAHGEVAAEVRARPDCIVERVVDVGVGDILGDPIARVERLDQRAVLERIAVAEAGQEAGPVGAVSRKRPRAPSSHTGGGDRPRRLGDDIELAVGLGDEVIERRHIADPRVRRSAPRRRDPGERVGDRTRQIFNGEVGAAAGRLVDDPAFTIGIAAKVARAQGIGDEHAEVEIAGARRVRRRQHLAARGGLDHAGDATAREARRNQRRLSERRDCPDPPEHVGEDRDRPVKIGIPVVRQCNIQRRAGVDREGADAAQDPALRLPPLDLAIVIMGDPPPARRHGQGGISGMPLSCCS
jgi:hypothetical protein